MIFQASDQQMDLFRWVRDGERHAMVKALAGTGKTTTIIEAIRYMQGSVALVAYNKKIAEELQAKIKTRMRKREDMRAGTFHSFGFSAWIRRNPQVKMEGDNERSIGYWKWDRIIQELNIPRPDKPLARCTRKLVSLAKQYGFGVEGIEPDDNPARWKWIFDHFNLQDDLFDEDTNRMPNEEEINQLMKVSIVLARRVLLKGIEIAPEVIDFDDMIYMPMRDPTCRIWQYDWVLIDECQDSNPVRRMFAQRMLRPEGRSIWIGDENQAIYGFGGADSESMNVIADTFKPVQFPLTTTYRCARSIVKYAQKWTPDMQPRPDAPEGMVKYIDGERMMAEGLLPTDAILCRNTAPLVEQALKLIRAGIGCRVEGRDIGQNLSKLAERWKRVKDVSILAERLREYRKVQTETLKKRGKEMQAATVADTVDSLLAIIDSLPYRATLFDLNNKIKKMFGDSEAGAPQTLLTLSTIHKAKGREWPRVFWYGYNVYNPSPYATQQWEMQQEENIMYVAATRAIDVLFKVTLKPKKEDKPIFSSRGGVDAPWDDAMYHNSLIQNGLGD